MSSDLQNKWANSLSDVEWYEHMLLFQGHTRSYCMAGGSLRYLGHANFRGFPKRDVWDFLDADYNPPLDPWEFSSQPLSPVTPLLNFSSF